MIDARRLPAKILATGEIYVEPLRYAVDPTMSNFGDELVALLPRLRRFARSLTGHADEADDLVQATFERALRSHALWEEGTRLDAWLFRIMKNLWIDQIRKRKVEGIRAVVDDAEQLSGSDGRSVSESRLALAEVETLVATLPGDQQAVLQCVCVEELSYQETADRLKIPIGTVMSRLSRARLALTAGLDTRKETESRRNSTRSH